MQSISREAAEAFAEALILNHGNATAAARSLKYDNASSTGHRYSRHPLVLKALAPLAQAHLAAMTPRAIQTLGSLLSASSAFVRLEAAKDILDRNGVGTSREPPRSQQLVVNINLGDAMLTPAQPSIVLDAADEFVSSTEGRGVENSHPLSSPTTPAHDFSTEVLDDRIVAPLQIERSSIPESLTKRGAGQNFFAEESDFDI